jgi:hypothetical protein
MDIGLPLSSPRGVMYLPSSLPPEPSGIQCFDKEDLTSKYLKWLGESSNRRVLTPLKRSNYREHLQNPIETSDHPDPVERQRYSNEKYHVLTNFELQDSQIYQKAEVKHSISFNSRYAVCYSDSLDIICRSHRRMGHASKY